MRILFLGIQPSAPLKSVLLSSPYSVEFHTKFTRNVRVHPDLIVVRTSNKANLALVDKLKKQHAAAWIAVIVSSRQLQDETFFEHLLRLESKNAVWLEETWELLFWPSLQQMHHQRSSHVELKALRSEVKHLRHQVDSLTHKSAKVVERFEKNLELALEVQRSLLPQRHPEIPGVQILTKYLPSSGLGGDYYDIFEFGDRRRFGFLLADSKSHGMAAALLSVLLKVRLEEVKEKFSDSNSLLDYIQREMVAHHDGPQAAMSLLYGIIDRATLEFRYTTAGHLVPHVWRQSKRLALPVAAHAPLGLATNSAFTEKSITLLPGDTLLLFSDGFQPVFEKCEPIFTKTASDPLNLRNVWMGKIDEYIEKKKPSDDITVIQITVDERALFLAS